MYHKRQHLLLTFRIFVVSFLFAGLSACTSTNTVKTKASANKSDLEALYWDRVESARMSSFTKADVKFMTGMICHHAQALVMSALAPENGASEQVQILASRIINSQKDEIASMQRWLRYRNQSVPQIEIEGINLMIEIDNEPFTAYRKMHGVLSQAQLKELANAKGTEFDRLFLSYMIEHHSGAVHMVKMLFGTDGAAQDDTAFRLASSIQVDQKTEIARMKRMLDDLAEINP